MPIAVGTKAPDFSLKSKNATGVSDVKLSANLGKKNTVITFTVEMKTRGLSMPRRSLPETRRDDKPAGN